MTLLFKALLGALVVVLIVLLSKTRNYYIAGLLPLFPTFALLAHYIVGSEALRMTILFGIWAVIPYLVYLISLYGFVGAMCLPLSSASEGISRAFAKKNYTQRTPLWRQP
ncbi:MAG: GlpM family protein [Sodalis sp. (in: enterobacteria)]|uniref:GlpM family protein n=1 Tax=Sodalis sp. (in: enterobacteria) TaxID=1898979 RepID=UPI0039E6FEFB